MPPLEAVAEPLSVFEFWPTWLFYGPLLVYIGWLMLRFRGITLATVVNPGFPAGGLVGESKSRILELAQAAAPNSVAASLGWDHRGSLEGTAAEAMQVCKALRRSGLDLPVVAKPDLGCRGAGVRLIRTWQQLVAYLALFPAGQRIVFQRFVDLEAEAGVFYVRRPGAPHGRILSLTLKYFPHVIGNGRSTLRELILADARAGRLAHLYLGRHGARLDERPAAGEAVRLAFAGSHSRGAIFRDGGALVTPAMEAAFDGLAEALPDFYFGRFDVRFTTIDELQAGHGFTVVEINGAGAEVTHIWDCRTSLRSAYRALVVQYRLLFEIGAINRARGARPMRCLDLWRLYRLEKRLIPTYPSTD